MKRHIRFTFNERGESVLLGPVSNPWPGPWRLVGMRPVAANGRRVPGTMVHIMQDEWEWRLPAEVHKVAITVEWV